MTFGGIAVFMLLFYELSITAICLTTSLMGIGMSFIYPITLITTQHSVAADQVAFATSGVSWIRNLGTTIGTTVMGVVLSLMFQRRFLETVPDAGSELITTIKQHPEVFFQGSGSSLIPDSVNVTGIFQSSLFWVFGIKFAAVAAALVISYFFPKKSIHGSS
jgi:hypothetical protein